MNIKSIRMTNWSFKLCEDNLKDMDAPCMDPVWIGAVPDEAMHKEVTTLKRAGFNALIVEGLRRMMLYEHNRVSAEVRAAIARAVGIAHAEGMKVFYHSTCSFANPSFEIFTEHEKTMLSIDGETGEYAFIENWCGWYLWCMNNPDFRAMRVCEKLLAAFRFWAARMTSRTRPTAIGDTVRFPAASFDTYAVLYCSPQTRHAESYESGKQVGAPVSCTADGPQPPS